MSYYLIPFITFRSCNKLRGSFRNVSEALIWCMYYFFLVRLNPYWPLNSFFRYMYYSLSTFKIRLCPPPYITALQVSSKSNQANHQILPPWRNHLPVCINFFPCCCVAAKTAQFPGLLLCRFRKCLLVLLFATLHGQTTFRCVLNAAPFRSKR